MNRTGLSFLRNSLAAIPLALTIVLSGCTQPSSPSGRPTYAGLTRTINLPNLRQTRPEVGVLGRIDHLAYDPETGRLFVAALENGSLEVIDLNTGNRVRSITNLSRPQGAAVVPSRHCVAVACGGDGNLFVYDTHTLEQKARVNVGPDADNVRYDASTETVLVSYGSNTQGGIAIFEPRQWTRIREIHFDSKPESFQLSPDGKRLFANLPKGVRANEEGSVAFVNCASKQVEAAIPLVGKARNFPMVFDAAHERLFVATRKPARLVEFDTKKAAIVTEAPCTDDSDDLFYDAQNSRVIIIGGGFRPDLQEPGSASPCSPPDETGALDVFQVGAKGELTLLSITPTALHARTGLFVPSRRALYLAVPFHGNRDTQIREYRIY